LKEDRESQERRLRAFIVEICRKLYDKGLIAGADGNLSCRISKENRYLVTPSGAHKGFITADDILLVDIHGNVLKGKGRPSSEWAVHRIIYEKDSNCSAIVHTHAPWTLAISLAGIGLEPHLLAEASMLLGRVPLVEYHPPGTEELANAVALVLDQGPAHILAHHGAITRGRDLWQAFQLMECLEHSAKITALARFLGDPSPLPF